MKYLSLFSGIGGFELGIQQAYEEFYNSCNNSREPQTKRELPTERKSVVSKNSKSSINKLQSTPLVSCIGYSEIDKYAIQIYQKHFNHKNYGDITTLNPISLPNFDLLVGGFPCQSFSIAGKRGGFMDTRGTLFFEICRIAREKQPRLLLLENVKGLLSHDKGRTFRIIISTLDELGYDLQWQVLNSKNFGVPQNRERVFIIGHLRGTSRPEVFPFGGTDKKVNEPDRSVASVRTSGDRGKQKTYLKYGEVQTLSANPMSDNIPRITQFNKPKHSNDRVYSDKGISPTLNTMQGGRRQPFVAAERGRYNKDGSTSQKLEARKDNVSNTLTGVEKDNRVVDGQIRRLTPTECERLQGFPDGWTEGLSDTQRYKTLGNAVTVNVIKEIIKKLL